MTLASPELNFAGTTTDDVASLLLKEWLVTNGLGGYASSSLLGIATRRYHGLFVPDLPGRGRTMIVPRVDEIVERGSDRILLSGAEYADGRIDSDGVRYLKQFRRERQIPVWTYDVAGSVLEKRVVAPHGQNTVYLQYALTDGPAVRLRLRPFVTFRMHDTQLSDSYAGPFSLTITQGRRYEVPLPDGAPPLKLGLRPRCGVFVSDELISGDVLYRVDRDRGAEHTQDLFSPGYFTAELSTGARVSLVASVEPWDLLELNCDDILRAEQQRLEKLSSAVPAFRQDEFVRQLHLAADQFVVIPGARPEEQALAHASGDEARTIIAGYHWFGDWGRDTMVSLEGLTLCTGRHQETRAILRTFAHYIKDGLIPNLFPEGARKGLYHTADATLWYFHALDRYLSATEDRDTLMMLYPVLKDVIRHHLKGTRFNIGMDPRDGLLHAGAPGYPLTWMDAKVEDWVVTPRRGKPVEIQALWYNALRLMAEWGDQLGERTDQWRETAERAEASFHRRYWFGQGGYLYDVVDGERGNDASLRPNQIFTLSLRFPVLRRERWRPVVDAVTDKLLTPFGLRSLSPDHPDYKPNYAGDLRARDAAYHQGTVWPWLIGHYIDARMQVYGDQAETGRLLDAFDGHFREAGLGTISEIFDAEPPYRPRGCIAQAWSVAEVLRAYLKTRDR
ncbi:MAG TPA: amylo-alpha-1,6-glucosidase [Nitrospira sp.]|nr:amylo-alpha-1,6-glucosidase [Nitrospira sp.]